MERERSDFFDGFWAGSPLRNVTQSRGERPREVHLHRYGSIRTSLALRGRLAVLSSFGAFYAFALPAFAVTTLTVDLSKPIGPAKHVANGSLYGVIETKPAAVQALIAPLHPNMFNNPAVAGSGYQQAWGDAIVVAGRVAPIGATVTIRLADWFPGWYSFTNMTDWLSKVDQTIARKKAANLTNIYAYELWNEPNGTWHSTSLTFNDFWKQTYDHVRAQDPSVKITGPSVAGYNQSYLSNFLAYCKTNNCLPDIVGWHDGSGIQANVQSYRALEKQLGIGPLPITINEYSLTADITHEGEPGASATLIAAMEREHVDSACVTYWDVPHPGRLGSLLATDTQTNGGWFFYKWYGEMTGQMLTTTSSLSPGSGNFDGFASLDTSKGVASVLSGGTNDGTLQIVVKGFAAASVPSTVHAVLEQTPWGSRSVVVTATNTLSTSELTVMGDQVVVSVPGANATDGYHLELSWQGTGLLQDAGSAAADSASSSGATSPDGSGGVSGSGSGLGAGLGSGAASASSGAGSSGSSALGNASDGGKAAGSGGAAGGQGCACGVVARGGSSSTASLFALALAAAVAGGARRRGRRTRSPASPSRGQAQRLAMQLQGPRSSGM
jgi:hypothetical protein